MGDQQITEIQVGGDQKPLQQLLYDAVRSNNRKLFDEELTKQNVVDFAGIPLMPGGNTVLHSAVLVGSKSMTEHLARRFPGAILKENDSGDTALHMAARSGQEETVSSLLKMTNSDNVTQLLRMVNDSGNTALHEAVLHGDKDGAIVTSLVSKDPEVAYLENFGKKSPLYLAVVKGDRKILPLLLENLPPLDGQLSKSPLRRAIKRGRRDLLEDMLNKRPEFMNLKNKRGRNALHDAAFFCDEEAINSISRVNPCYHLERDKEGLYPLLVACESGSVKVFETLVSIWQDPTQVLDNKHQNILHIAAKNGRDHVVRRILRDQKLAPKFINSQDIEGNTPLHLASMNGHCLVVGDLLLSKADATTILNEQGLTPYEVAEERVQNLHKESKEQRGQIEIASKNNASNNSNSPRSSHSMMALSILFQLHIYRILFGCRFAKFFKEIMKSKGKVDREDIKDRVGNLIVVATLIAGLAFAGITQMPKGDDNTTHSIAHAPPPQSLSRGNNVSVVPNAPPPEPFVQQIIQKMTHLTYVQIYIFFVTIALDASILAAILLCAFRVVDDNIAAFFTWMASLLVAVSLYALCTAFGFAALIGIGDKPKTFGFSDDLFSIQCWYVLLMSVALVPLFIPLPLKNAFVRFLYATAFLLHYIVYRCWDFCFNWGHSALIAY